MSSRLIATIATTAVLLALAWPGLAGPVRAQGPDVAPPAIRLEVQPARPAVGQETTASWQVTGAVSVSVRRNGTQLSTAAAGEVSCTILDKRPVVWRVEASNRGGSSSEEITVRPVTFGSWAAFISSGWSAPAGCGSASWS